VFTALYGLGSYITQTRFVFGGLNHSCTNPVQCKIHTTYLLTYSMEQSPSWEANWFCSWSRNSPHFTEPESSLPQSQVAANCPYPEPTPSSPHNPLALPAGPYSMYLQECPFSFSCGVILRLETLLPGRSDWGSSLPPDCFVSRGSISPCEYYIRFYGEDLLAPRPTPKLEDHPLSAVRDCLFNLFAATLHIGARSSIRNLRTRHAVVTGTHLSWKIHTTTQIKTATAKQTSGREADQSHLSTEKVTNDWNYTSTPHTPTSRALPLNTRQNKLHRLSSVKTKIHAVCSIILGQCLPQILGRGCPHQLLMIFYSQLS
jgi:hypothetical protein